jgi:hypothetical protein
VAWSAVLRFQRKTRLQSIVKLVHHLLVHRIWLSPEAFILNTLSDLQAVSQGLDAPPNLGTWATLETFRTHLRGAAALTRDGVAYPILFSLQLVEFCIGTSLVRLASLLRCWPYLWCGRWLRCRPLLCRSPPILFYRLAFTFIQARRVEKNCEERKGSSRYSPQA